MSDEEATTTLNHQSERLSDDSDGETAGSSKDQQQQQQAPAPAMERSHPDSDDDEWDDGPLNKIVRSDNHTTVVASHYNQIQERGLKVRNTSRIVYMRNFNNWIKSVVISKYLSLIREKTSIGSALRVMDMCCGKGGDLLKWTKSNITHLICTDIAEVSVEQCEARYNSTRQRPENGKMFSAEFFAADATLQQLRKKYKDPSISLHLVSCQFAFHYCFESLKQAEIMLKNAAECLLTGHYFIGTIPDAYEIMKRQRAAGSDSFGNDCYRITFLCDTEKPPLFGAKYNFQLDGVVDCPEFLVHFPTLVKLARKFGLKLVEQKRFDELFDEAVKVREHQSLLGRMQAMETFPGFSYDDKERQRNQQEYQHAQQFLQRGRRGPIGTLSKSEWEVSTLYMYFAFQKMKTSWDAKGKPVYE